MAATNHTTPDNLSQFVSTDKPSFLGDYNGDMKRIQEAFTRRDNTIATLQSQLSDTLTRLHALDGK